jgi:CUG-BP- and ETR3-like factor
VREERDATTIVFKKKQIIKNTMSSNEETLKVKEEVVEEENDASGTDTKNQDATATSPSKKEEKEEEVEKKKETTEAENEEKEEEKKEEEEEGDKDTSVKLFVGQIPKTMMEDDIKPLFSKFGEVIDVTVIRDKTNGSHRGCAFVTFSEASPANEAMDAYHDKETLPKMHNPMQVKKAYVFSERTASHRRPPSEIKLFVGMVPHSASEADVRVIFAKYGTVEEVYILRDKAGDSRGCAFVRYASRDEALRAIQALHHNVTMDGSPSSLVVKFADSKREKYGKRGKFGDGRGRHRQGGNRSDSRQHYRGGRGNRTGSSSDRGRSGSRSTNGSFSHSHFVQNWQGQGQQQYGGVPYGMPPPQGYPQYGSTGYYGYGGYGGMYSPSGYNYPISPGGYFTPPYSPTSAGGSSSKLTVQNIPKEYKDSDLQRLFSPFGKIQEARIISSAGDGGLQTGIVVYEDPVSTRAALDNMNGFEAGSSRLVVSPAPSPPKPGSNTRASTNA